MNCFLFYYMRTLIVDDMEDVYEKLKGHFKDSRYAKTVEEGLRELASGNYDLIISDYHFENSLQGGLEIIKAAKNKGLTRILMSKENHRKEAKELGAIFMFKKELFKLLEGYDGRK